MEHIKFSGFVKAEYPHSDNCRVIFPPNSIGFFVLYHMFGTALDLFS